MTAVFTDVEMAVTDVLVPALDPVRVCTRIPSPRPAEFVRLFRTGGPAETRVTEAALITVEAWADLESRAVTLLNLARAVLRDLDGQLFGVSEYGGPANLPDPTTSQVRYTASFVVRARATPTA
jgi:hypothetical protein